MSAEKQRKRRVATPPAPTTGVRLIRKYGNRRLYDTHTSRYVTLGDLVEVFEGEGDVKVTDAVSGDDLTKRVLAQAILFEEGRRRTQILPIRLLRDLLRHRGEGPGLERKLQKVLSEAGGAHGTRHKADTGDGAELDELKRRLKALESQIGKKR